MIYYSVTLSLSGLGFGFLIGILSGALSFIPFVGAIFGALASIGLAILQFWPDDMLRIAIIAGIYIVGQVLEGYILTPRLVGNRIGLHPVWVMFGVLGHEIGGAIAFVGRKAERQLPDRIVLWWRRYVIVAQAGFSGS